MDGLWSTKSEVVGLIAGQLVFKISNLCSPDPPTSHRGRQTDDMQSQYRAQCTIVHRAVKTTDKLGTFTNGEAGKISLSDNRESTSDFGSRDSSRFLYDLLAYYYYYY